jgi:hypothetical protein
MGMSGTTRLGASPVACRAAFGYPTGGVSARWFLLDAESRVREAIQKQDEKLPRAGRLGWQAPPKYHIRWRKRAMPLTPRRV